MQSYIKRKHVDAELPSFFLSVKNKHLFSILVYKIPFYFLSARLRLQIFYFIARIIAYLWLNMKEMYIKSLDVGQIMSVVV